MQNGKDAVPFCSRPCPTVTVDMGKFMKVVLVLARCYSGCKVVIVKNIDDGISDHPYTTLWGARIDCCLHKVTAVMGRKKIARVKDQVFCES